MHPNVVDWVALGVIAVSALAGMRRGLVVSALSLGGLLAGGYFGSRIAPHVLHGGSSSPWTGVAGLVGAIFGAVLFQTAAVFAGSVARGTLRFTPLRFLDSLGGLAFGLATGLVLVWVVGAAALLVPNQPKLHRYIRQSEFVRRLDEAVPPSHFLHLLARIDPYPSIAGPAPPRAKPTPHIATNATVLRASRMVVRVIGTACGVGIEGTGWFVGRNLVVTAAHVVAGEHDTKVVIPGSSDQRVTQVVAYDPHDDVAVLRVQHAFVRTPLPLADPIQGASVAIVGYPANGKQRLVPGTVGQTGAVLTEDAYGAGPVSRVITTLAGVIRHGDSGGPAIDADGQVEATVFATSVGKHRAPGGYGVPASVVRRVIATASSTFVSTGACANG